jgi:hypothetical protein
VDYFDQGSDVRGIGGIELDLERGAARQARHHFGAAADRDGQPSMSAQNAVSDFRRHVRKL